MSFSNIDTVALGNLLQIKFSDGIRNQISSDFRDWEMVLRAKESNSAARELRFLLLSAFGVDAINYANPGQLDSPFPSADRSTLTEFIAKYKEVRSTIEVQYDLFERALMSPEKYGEPVRVEMDSKLSASKRRLAADYGGGDGTGVLGTIASSTTVAGNALVQLLTTDVARGHAGMFEYQQKLVPYAANGTAGTAPTLAAGTFAYFLMIQKDRGLQQLTLQAINTLGAQSNVTAYAPASGEVLYRKAQSDASDIPNLGSIADYGTASQVIAGLESLTADDGRVIHGMTMSGAFAGSRYDAGANPLDVKHIQRAMSQVKVRVGQDQYKWKMMVMAPESYDSLVESRETDRRFVTLKDDSRGASQIYYQHQNDSLECYTSEYCLPKRIYIMPETKAGQKVIEFHGSDFKTVKAPSGSDFHLKPSSSGYVATIVSYLQAIGVIVCKHPASISVIHNFTNS